jgi:hypothetical protein
MTLYQPNDWKQLAEQASNEQDPEKFMTLIHELNRVLSEGEAMTSCNTVPNLPVLHSKFATRKSPSSHSNEE